ncbi:MAG TPA: N-acyl-D-amino acid deacylase, partial [Polyangiaceae bacterium]
MRTLITNAQIIDGTGAPAREGELLLEDATIAAVGDVAGSGRPDQVLDARGLVVAPGFIDMHSHSDFALP